MHPGNVSRDFIGHHFEQHGSSGCLSTAVEARQERLALRTHSMMEELSKRWCCVVSCVAYALKIPEPVMTPARGRLGIDRNFNSFHQRCRKAKGSQLFRGDRKDKRNGREGEGKVPLKPPSPGQGQSLSHLKGQQAGALIRKKTGHSFSITERVVRDLQEAGVTWIVSGSASVSDGQGRLECITRLLPRVAPLHENVPALCLPSVDMVVKSPVSTFPP